MSAWKSGRLSDVAEHNRLPAVSMIESAGADLPNQSKIFVPGGRGFRDLTRRSEARIPTICLVFGSSTAGGAYIPGMSDYVVMVQKQAQVYLAGPPLVKMATGEDTDHEELGGAEMHSRVSGVSDYLARDERDAIRIGREIVAHLGWRKGAAAGAAADRAAALRSRGAARRDLARRQGPVRSARGDRAHRRRLAVLRVQAAVRPDARVRLGALPRLPGRASWPTTASCSPESAQKGAQFIELCNQSDVPLLFLQNVTGFMVGKKVEQEGIIKHGAKLINAVSNSTVPAITIMTGASYGAGNYAMCGRAYAPRFLFTWPNHRIAVMGGKQLAGVLEIIQREAAQKRGDAVDEQKLAFGKAMIEAQIDKESDPYFATARLWDDGIIDPRDTRTVVAIALSAAYSAPVQGTTSWGVFRALGRGGSGGGRCENAGVVLGRGPRGCHARGAPRGSLARELLCFAVRSCPHARRLVVLERPVGPSASPRGIPARGAPRGGEGRSLCS